MTIRRRLQSTLRGGRRYGCVFCGQRFDNERESCPACGGSVTGRL